MRILLTLFTLLSFSAQAEMSLNHVCPIETKSDHISSEQIAEFDHRLSNAAIIDLRLSYVELYAAKACLKNLKSKHDCKDRNEKLRKQAKKYYKQMRLALALSSPGYGGDSYNDGYPYKLDITKLRPYNIERVLTIDLKHQYSNLTGDLPPLTDKEMKQGIESLNNTLIEFQKSTYGKELEVQDFMDSNQNEISQYLSANNEFFRQVRKSKLGRYKAALNRMPLIGFMTSESPSDEEFITMIDKLIDNNRKMVNQINESNNIAHLATATRLLKLAPEYCDVAKMKLEDFKDSEFYKDMGMLGVIITGSIGCQVMKIGLLSKGICQSVFGLGFNALYVYSDENRLTENYHRAFSSLYHNNRLADVAAMDEYEFASFISWITLPIGTGIKDIYKAYEQTHRRMK